MNVRKVSTMLCLIGIGLMAKAAPVRWYVSTEGRGAQDGTSWDNASAHLQRVIDQCCAGDTVWVSQGRYVGGFVMREGVTVIGGFAGTEKALEERCTMATDGWQTELNGEGTFRVLQQAKDFGITTLWDGFLLTNGIGSKGAGALLHEEGMLRNCIIEGNSVGKLALGEYSKEAGGIVCHTLAGGKACILSAHEEGRNYQSERAAEVVKLHTEAGLSDWRLPTAPELKALLPSSDAGYSTLCLTEMTLAEAGGTPIEGSRCWTSTASTSNGLKAAGTCDFTCMQYIPLNIYQYNKVRPVRDCTHPTTLGAGAGIYAEGGCLMDCLVSNNIGANDIEGNVTILTTSEDGLAQPIAGSQLVSICKAGSTLHYEGATTLSLYDCNGHLVCRGKAELTLPSAPGLYILHLQTATTTHSQKITLIP